MTIPASQIAAVTPGVIAAGGSNLSLNGLFLTENLLMPTGQVLSFPSQAAVGAFFGLASAEHALAGIYFGGYNNSTVKPSAMLFAPYNAAARSAWLQGGSMANVTLAQLQAFSGVLTVTFDGTANTSANISLAAATSFSNAATLILAGFTAPTFTVAWNATQNCFVFTDSTTGATSTVVFASGSLAADLNLTQATGATLSQGAPADTPTTAMQNVYAVSQNWESMVPMTEPSLSDKELFAQWFNEQNDQFVYLAWDSDVQACVANATEPFGVVAKAAQYNGVACIGGDPAAVPAGNTLGAMALNVATFIAGAIASINFGQENGRTTLAFLSQSGLLPTCANLTTATNLLANGYSYCGATATRANNFVFFYNGNMPGVFGWLDTFIDDSWLQDQFQVALLSLATSAGSVPYVAPGYGQIRNALVSGPIKAALNFGAIRSGVNLSSVQVADITAQYGAGVATLLSTQGWYLQVSDPGATARQNRTSPIINFLYTDGGAIQKFSMNAFDVL